MKSYSKFLLAVMLLTLVAGCAFTDSTVKIDYKPTQFTPVSGSKSTVTVERFTDQRGVEPNLLSYKGVQTKTSGKYLSEQEVSMVVTDATKDLLKQLGYTVLDNGGDYMLSGELLKFESYVIMGFWSGQLEGMAQVNLKVKDGKSGVLLWNELFTTTAKKTGLQIDHENHRKDVAESTLDSLMKKIAESSSLKKVLEVKNP
jgi:hypothetical protein